MTAGSRILIPAAHVYRPGRFPASYQAPGLAGVVVKCGHVGCVGKEMDPICPDAAREPFSREFLTGPSSVFQIDFIAEGLRLATSMFGAPCALWGGYPLFALFARLPARSDDST